MQDKVILMLIDGMRPDAIKLTGHTYPDKLKKKATYSYDTQTVLPSATLPAHISLFHGISPDRHGILSNDYVPMPNPIEGLFEHLKGANKKNAFFYTWEPLRDIITKPRCLNFAYFQSQFDYSNYNDLSTMDTFNSDKRITDKAIEYIDEQHPDFIFLYLGDVDEYGHYVGWMTDEYIKGVKIGWDCIEKICEKYQDEYNIIITADHGGHDRIHGSDMPEDMLIPLFCLGSRFEKGKELHGASILDIAPTICDICGVSPVEEWEGKSLLKHNDNK